MPQQRGRHWGWKVFSIAQQEIPKGERELERPKVVPRFGRPDVSAA